MIVFSLYSIKGGVGKTAAAVNLAYLASQEGRSTLLIDLDPQGAASFYLRTRPAKKQTKGELIAGKNKQIIKRIKGSDFLNLDIIPADFSYRNMDLALVDKTKSQKRLGKRLTIFKKEYDFVFLDSPPNITLFSENIFAASDFVLSPVIPTTLSERTLEKLQAFFYKKKFKSPIVPFFSMVETRKKMHRETMENLASGKIHFLSSSIPYSSDVEKMGVFRQPLNAFKPRSKAAVAFSELWQEIKDLTS